MMAEVRAHHTDPQLSYTPTVVTGGHVLVGPDENIHEQGGCANAAGHRPGCVLTVRDGNDARLWQQSNGRFQPDHSAERCGTHNRTVGLRADGEWRQTRGECSSRSG